MCSDDQEILNSSAQLQPTARERMSMSVRMMSSRISHGAKKKPKKRGRVKRWSEARPGPVDQVLLIPYCLSFS